MNDFNSYPCQEHAVRLDRIENAMDAVNASNERLANAIEMLSITIKTLSGTHLKIIYWLLILISSAFVGTKAAEIAKLFNAIG